MVDQISQRHSILGYFLKVNEEYYVRKNWFTLFVDRYGDNNCIGNGCCAGKT
jgi:hypothetical protein